MEFVKSLFRPSAEVAEDKQADKGMSGHKNLSFNDFSLHTADDAEAELSTAALVKDMGAENNAAADNQEPPSTWSHKGTRNDVWHEVFNPGTNRNMEKVGRSMFDSVDDKKHEPTVWDHIVKADTLRKISFATFDKNNDGFIDKEELQKTLGGCSKDIEQLMAAADKNGDGKIDYNEFCELLRNA